MLKLHNFEMSTGTNNTLEVRTDKQQAVKLQQITPTDIVARVREWQGKTVLSTQPIDNVIAINTVKTAQAKQYTDGRAEKND